MSPKEVLSQYINEAKKDLSTLETIKWPLDRQLLTHQIASLKNFIDCETKILRSIQ